MRFSEWLALGLVVGFGGACAKGSSLDGTGGSGASGGSGGASASSSVATSGASTSGPTTSSTSVGSTSSGGPTPQSCPVNQFATGIDSMGTLMCAPVDAATNTAVSAGCSAFLGWRDGCNGCGLVPSKWGRSGTNVGSCSNGVGLDDTCTSPSLGGTAYQLFGLNPDGDVDDNDTFSFGFTCQPDAPGGSGPCAAGQFVTGISGNTVTCSALGALDYVRSSCSLYAGWMDSCNGCALPPTKWGSVGAASCQNGAGANDTCTTQALGADMVQLFGLNTDGDVNDDDKFYVGMGCTTPADQNSMAIGACPTGQLVTGIDGMGGVTCVSPAPLIATYVRAHCEVVFGWSDSCNGCTTTPTKWGRVRDGFCENGIGLDDTCIVATLGTSTVSLFGLNTDGNVNDDDKFFLDFACH